MGIFALVFGVLVLLKNGILWFLVVMALLELIIHPPINIGCISRPFQKHAATEHQRTSSKLDCSLHQPITQPSPSFFHTNLFPSDLKLLTLVSSVMVYAQSHSFRKNNHRMALMEPPMMATLPLFSTTLTTSQPQQTYIRPPSEFIHYSITTRKPSFLSLPLPTSTTCYPRQHT